MLLLTLESKLHVRAIAFRRILLLFNCSSKGFYFFYKDYYFTRHSSSKLGSVLINHNNCLQLKKQTKKPATKALT